MKRFTFIMDFRGGTYVGQATGKKLRDAMRVWAQELPTSEIKYFGNKGKDELIAAIDSEESAPVALSGLLNVWCMSVRIRAGFLLINIVETAL